MIFVCVRFAEFADITISSNLPLSQVKAFVSITTQSGHAAFDAKGHKHPCRLALRDRLA